MEEENHNDALPDLKELENKVGRKTPESLLIWMRDAADCEDGGRSEVVDREERSSALSDSFSDKINNLKQEMRGLRSADVRILRQLVAVHEGIEAMRWLMEERDNLASRDSSLTGSLSSLVTVEEHGPSMSPYRESLSPTQDLTETTGEESEDHPPHTDHGDSTHKSYLSPEFTRASPPSPSSKFEVNCSTQGRHDQASSSPANGLVSANLPKSQPQDLDIKDGAKTIRRALLRSRRASRPVIVDNGSFALTKQSEETQTEHQTQDGFRAFQNNTMEKEESPPNKDTILLGYDAQWCWVESQDDVTFL
ncbi:Leucine rich adaptor protein 1 Leucine repeat adapter protein 35A [Larimichthys crocea]|uniref:Leucine rich adaptor protein 1 Leucine repeat adapter protein 35A n=1 Tax=Larimichthys crocea TaxID=215358 RepID=A0A6G0IIY4_LARCR|nr:Leucine rich adaptor protein 1 Leucine repeat adapter protein 35A [Larimichthys crocea]